MFYDNFRLNNRNYTLANQDYSHVAIERMLETAEKKLKFTFKDLIIEGHDWPGAIDWANYSSLKEAYNAMSYPEMEISEEIRSIDGYNILADEDSIVKFLNAYLSVGAGHEVCLHDVSPNKVVRFDLSH